MQDGRLASHERPTVPRPPGPAGLTVPEWSIRGHDDDYEEGVLVGWEGRWAEE